MPKKGWLATIKEPHHAVCCLVLNLLLQVRVLPEISVLAKAYHVIFESMDPSDECWPKTGDVASRAQQGTFFIPQMICCV
jgi:hypothetical protein